MVFGGSQVLMDIEPLVGILEGRPILHGVTHTILGALVIGLVAGVIGRPISELVLKWLRIKHHPMTWTASLLSGLVGTLRGDNQGENPASIRMRKRWRGPVEGRA